MQYIHFPARIQQFLERIPEEYRHIKIAVSGENVLPPDLPFESTPETTALLSLNESYETLTGRYTSDLFRQMDKATTAKLMLTANLKPEKIADFYEKHTKDRRDLDARYHALLRIMYNALHRGWASLLRCSTHPEIPALPIFSSTATENC